MSKIIFPLILLFSAHGSIAQKADSLLPFKNWHSYPIPTDEKILALYSQDTTTWTVYTQNEKICAINTYKPNAWKQPSADSLPAAVVAQLFQDQGIVMQRGPRIIPVDDGFLIGINKGEFGAALLWYSKDGKRKYKISNHQVVQIIKKEGEIFAIQGLSHLDVSEGSMIKIRKDHFKWNAIEYLHLPAAPIGIVVDSKNNFIVATSKNLIAIGEKKQMTILLDNAFWNAYTYLYPRSLAIQHDIIYIGMRKGIFKYNIDAKKGEWLMKD